MSESSPKDTKSASPLAAFRDPAQAALGNNASTLLRRRKEPANPFAAASKALGVVADLTKKVRLDAITEAFIPGDKKRQVSALPASAPMGVTHAYSVMVTHVVAPLWSVGAQSVGVHPAIAFNDTVALNFARLLDTKGWDIETVCDSLNSDTHYATIYIAFLLAKLLCLENQEWRVTFTELAAQIARDVRPKKEYEEHRNDENTTHDQPRRKLTEVGGAWRPRGAVELPPALAQLRQLCISRCMQASVCFKYLYTDENVQSLVDALSSQLFLVNYSESVVQLVAGIKGDNYVAKYFVHAARTSGDVVDADSALCEAEVRAPVLEAVTAAVELALQNLIHRNDTYEIVLNALIKALGICPPRQVRSLIQITKETLALTYCADLATLAGLLDAVRPFVLQPNPVGKEAHDLMVVIWSGIRCVGSASRSVLASLFVAGDDLRSFRKRPAHLYATPYTARAFLLTRTSHGEIPMQRGANPMLPVALPANIDPTTGAALSVLLDDTVLYIANHVSNVFQQALELTSYEAEALAEDDHAEARQAETQGRDRTDSGQTGTLTDAISRCQLVDLGHLFSIPPMQLCASMPMMQMLLHPSKGIIFSDPKHTKPETLITIADQYGVVAAAHKPAKGQRRFRLESPRPPLRPLLITIGTENEEAMITLKGILNNHWKYCDQRITDKEPAYLHPKRDLSLSHFIEQDIDLVVVGGSGTVRRLAETIVRLRIDFPGAVPTIRIYLLPAGYDNDMAAWLARTDALYNQRVFAPFACLPTVTVDTLSIDSLTLPPTPTFETLSHRNIIAHYLNHGKVANEVVLYQVECVSADGALHYIVMCSNFEIGAHVTAAVYRDQFTTSRDALSPEPFAAKELQRATDTRSGLSMRRGKSSMGLTRQTSDAGAVPPSVKLTKDHLHKLSTVADTMVKQFSVTQSIAISSSNDEAATTDRLESCDRILARMHSSYRGVPLATRRHPLEARDIPFCCAGTDLLDWISTSYHIYDTKVAARTASRMLERGIIICAAAASGKTMDKFSEANLYVLRPREDSDTVPLAVASDRSRTFDMAMSMRETVQEAPIPKPGGGPSSVPFVMKAKIIFTPRRGDPQYIELSGTSGPGSGAASVVSGGTEQTASLRTNVTELVTLKLKSAGASGDRGHLPNPCLPCAQLTIHDAERKRYATSFSTAGPSSPGKDTSPSGTMGGANASATNASLAGGAADAKSQFVKPSNTGSTPDTGDYFTIRFGDEKGVDSKCVLAIDIVDDGVMSPAGLTMNYGIVGVHCCIDGDIFGPFVGFRIKPILGKDKETAMTIPFMSYMRCTAE